MQTWVIYAAKHRISESTYVGLTHRSLEQRKQEHETQARLGRLKRFHYALSKYGKDAFDWVILHEGITSLIEACKLEVESILKLNAHVSMGGLNLTFGGEGTSGFKHTDESRKKIGDRFRGIPKSEEQRQKMGASISAARKGKIYGPRKFKDPERARANMRAAQQSYVHIRKPHSEETKEKLRKPKSCYVCSVCKQNGHSSKRHKEKS